MTRVLELLVSLLIVAALVVIVGVLLPSHGHIERSIEVSSPLRQIYDSVNTLRRFPEWSPERRLDPMMRMEYLGPRTGVDAMVNYSGNESVGKGSLKIIASDEDSQVRWLSRTISSARTRLHDLFDPSETGKTTPSSGPMTSITAGT